MTRLSRRTGIMRLSNYYLSKDSMDNDVRRYAGNLSLTKPNISSRDIEVIAEKYGEPRVFQSREEDRNDA